MVSINKLIWKLIENDTAIKKNLQENLINVSALARKMAKENNLTNNIEGVTSAIRRFESNEEKKKNTKKIYDLLKNSKVNTRTKLSSVLFKKNSQVREELGNLYSQINFEGNETLRIFEVSKYIKIIIDESNIDLVKKMFKEKYIVEIVKNIGEVSIDYNVDITKTSGLFATLSNELGMNDISIVDSMICYSEHIIIVNQKELKKTFDVIFNLTNN